MNQLQINEKEESVSADLVEDYLLKHSAFFADRPELLEIMRIPHNCAPAVSLVTKQMDLLRKTNAKQERQLKELVQIARENDTLSRRMHKLTLALFDVDSLEEAVASLEQVLHEYFSADFVALKAASNNESSAISNLVLAPDDPALDQFTDFFEKNRPKCGHMNESQSEFLFRENASEIGSYAVIPLQGSRFRGLLGIGSRDQDHFQPAMGLLFLTQMGELVSLRLSAFL